MEAARRRAKSCAGAVVTIIFFGVFTIVVMSPWADIAFTVQTVACTARDGTYSKVPCARSSMIWTSNTTGITSHLSRVAIARNSTVYFGGPKYFCADARASLGMCGIARAARANGIAMEVECAIFIASIGFILLYNADLDNALISCKTRITQLAILSIAAICACAGLLSLADQMARARHLGRARFTSVFVLMVIVKTVELTATCTSIAVYARKLARRAQQREGEKNVHNIEMQ